MRAALAVALNRMGLSVCCSTTAAMAATRAARTEEGLAADARAAQAWLAAQPDVDPQRIVYFGESLGAAVAVGLAVAAAAGGAGVAVAVHVAGRRRRRALSVAAGPAAAARPLSVDRRIASVPAPLLVIAGDRDDIVPESLSRRLYDAAGEPKRYVVVPGAGHNDPALLDGRQMLDEIGGFLSATGAHLVILVR